MNHSPAWRKGEGRLSPRFRVIMFFLHRKLTSVRLPPEEAGESKRWQNQKRICGEECQTWEIKKDMLENLE
ncbi:hypothetical protein SADUNF_Sadunf10G0067100 [Salix dunnii]|uniref:Uncharacterized protein n=1 Tax=Salix dunnii TaxID=1413687 RepID=A0A835JSL2_9ROSI|nr:hypothetical protein SADUNF_Sadunf10G0067100 [Salix dunnii]